MGTVPTTMSSSPEPMSDQREDDRVVHQEVIVARERVDVERPMRRYVTTSQAALETSPMAIVPVRFGSLPAAVKCIVSLWLVPLTTRRMVPADGHSFAVHRLAVHRLVYTRSIGEPFNVFAFRLVQLEQPRATRCT